MISPDIPTVRVAGLMIFMTDTSASDDTEDILEWLYAAKLKRNVSDFEYDFYEAAADYVLRAGMHRVQSRET